MGRQNSLVSWTAVSLALSMQLALVPSAIARAQEPSGWEPLGQLVASVTFEPPDSTEVLDDSEGGASRDGGYCPRDGVSSAKLFAPLMPANNVGLTLAERPTLFVYVPKTSATQAYLTVKDKSEDYYYQTTVVIPEKAGIVGIPLPDDAPALEIGRNYQWTFLVACENPPRPDSPRVSGWIERVKPDWDLSASLEGEASLEKANLYGSKGLWYDTLATLSELQRSHPEEYAEVWQEFLTSVGLESIASEPLLYQ